MGLNDLIYSIPLGVIYSLFVQKLCDVIFGDYRYNEKNQKYIMLLFISGVVGIILAKTIFTSNKKFQNKIIKDGLIIGGIILILYTVLSYWDKMTNETKLLIIGVVLGGLFWYCYNTNTKEDLIKTNKNIEYR